MNVWNCKLKPPLPVHFDIAIMLSVLEAETKRL